MDLQNILELIKHRRSIPMNKMNDTPISESHLMQILECANNAPTHKMTQPWRFVIFQDNARKKLADFLVKDYITYTPIADQSDVKIEKMSSNPTKANVVLAIILNREPNESLPEWEEVAALACAVQNMWLYATSLGVGCYWSTPGAIHRMHQFLELEHNQKCYGLFYMGYHDLPLWEGKRTPIEEKIRRF
jgi:nitroreductase